MPSPATYDEWVTACRLHVVPASPEQAARFWNLEKETRLSGPVVGAVRSWVAVAYTDELSQPGATEASAAGAVLVKLQKHLKQSACPWLGASTLKPVLPKSTKTVITHLPWSRILKDFRVAAVAGKPPRGVTLTSSIKNPAFCRFVWVTFATAGGEVSRTDPTAVKCELGLAHYPPADVVFRIEIEVRADHEYCVPSCLDAGLYEAWRMPSSTHTDHWGLTRNLVTGEQKFPELVLEARTCAAQIPLSGRVVSLDHPDGRIDEIQKLDCDYMIGRHP